MNIEEILKTTVELPIQKKVLVNLLYTENWVQDKINVVFKEFDISIQQYNVLRILKGQKGKPANLSTIQERMVSKMSNTTRLVDKLIKKDLAKRVTCAENRRKVEITITQKGIKFLAQVDPSVNSFEKELMSNLTEKELILFDELLNKIRS